MLKNRFFLVVPLVAIAVVRPAFSDTTATREWVKAQVYDKYVAPMGDALNTINNRLATDVRDKIYTYDKDTKTVSNPLRTDGQNAFDGINELLTKVDGNDGTENSAVTLNTTAQNAFGAINELKDDVDTVYDNGTQKRVNVTIVNDFTSNDFNAIKAAAENND